MIFLGHAKVGVKRVRHKWTNKETLHVQVSTLIHTIPAQELAQVVGALVVQKNRSSTTWTGQDEDRMRTG